MVQSEYSSKSRLPCTRHELISLLSSQLRNHVFRQETIMTSLRALRDALWPGGIMGPPRIPPTPIESQKIRQSAEIAALHALLGTPFDHSNNTNEIPFGQDY